MVKYCNKRKYTDYLLSPACLIHSGGQVNKGSDCFLVKIMVDREVTT